jgi:hypothetical protein
MNRQNFTRKFNATVGLGVGEHDLAFGRVARWLQRDYNCEDLLEVPRDREKREFAELHMDIASVEKKRGFSLVIIENSVRTQLAF